MAGAFINIFPILAVGRIDLSLEQRCWRFGIVHQVSLFNHVIIQGLTLSQRLSKYGMEAWPRQENGGFIHRSCYCLATYLRYRSARNSVRRYTFVCVLTFAATLQSNVTGG